MNTDKRLMPQHKVCDTNVEVPTIVVASLKMNKRPQVFIQWFGEADGIDLAEMQFLFPLPTATDDPIWMNHPENFEIIFLGQVSDWPRPQFAQSIADQATNGELEGRIVWLTSSHYSLEDDEEGSVPPCFVISMPAMLADGNCGIILPKKYFDETVLIRARDEAKNSS